jgi:hypothetical protein
MRQRKSGSIMVAFLAAASVFGLAHANEAGTEFGWSLILRYGDAITLSESDIQPLYSKAVEIVASSNFNSRAPLWEWNLNEILTMRWSGP